MNIDKETYDKDCPTPIVTTADGVTAYCAWCCPHQNLLRFSITWWVRRAKDKRWMSVTSQNKALYCPMCGRKLEVEV